jgi:hypothetical protein
MIPQNWAELMMYLMWYVVIFGVLWYLAKLTGMLVPQIVVLTIFIVVVLGTIHLSVEESLKHPWSKA